jgi:hypothetical protein
MTREIGTRVLAVSHSDETTLYIFGEGVYMGDERPPDGTPGFLNDGSRPYPPGYTNPKILLDSGEVVWGNQCWWQPLNTLTAQRWLEKYEGHVITIPIPSQHPG